MCEKLKYAGVRVLVSNAISDAVECYIAYEERNEVEHAFNTLKSRLSCNRTQVHTTEAWEGKLFLQMLATAISAIVRARIKIYNQGAVGKNGQKKYRVHYDSDHKLLAKLNNIYMTHVNDGWVFDEIVEEKKELFRILNLPVPTSGQFVEQNDAQEAPDDLIDIEEIATETAFDDVADLRHLRLWERLPQGRMVTCQKRLRFPGPQTGVPENKKTPAGRMPARRFSWSG
ncbi:MAG: hypothetical protein ACLUNV_11600 [Sutterella wadsworthensis]